MPIRAENIAQIIGAPLTVDEARISASTVQGRSKFYGATIQMVYGKRSRQVDDKLGQGLTLRNVVDVGETLL